MMTATEIKTVQVFPRGAMYRISGSYPHYLIHKEGEPDRDATEKENKEIQAHCLAENYLENEVFCNDSCLVDALLSSDKIDGFSWDEVENVYVDPSDWDAEQCKEYMDDNCIEYVSEREDEDEDDLMDDWKELIRDYSQENPSEAFQWFRVNSWLCDQLRESGEIVLDNDYGCWWGRGCCGQGVIMDGTLQRVAMRFLDNY